MIRVDISTDPRGEQLRNTIKPLIKAMRELLDNPDMPPLETIYANRADYLIGDSEKELDACRNTRIEIVNRYRKLIRSISEDGYEDRPDLVKVVVQKRNGQFSLAGGGGHRTASLLALGWKSPAMLIDPEVDNEFIRMP